MLSHRQKGGATSKDNGRDDGSSWLGKSQPRGGRRVAAAAVGIAVTFIVGAACVTSSIEKFGATPQHVVTEDDDQLLQNWQRNRSHERISYNHPQFRTIDVVQPPLSSYPTPQESTILFLHVFKCAGTTLREVFTGWAEEEGAEGSVVYGCDVCHPQSLNQMEDQTHGMSHRFVVHMCDGELASTVAGRVCVNHRNELITTNFQIEYVRTQKVLAGHFFWGFQEWVTKPYLIVTTLRNPLELHVSGQQFKNRKETSELEYARKFLTRNMVNKLLYYQEQYRSPHVGYLRRIVDSRVTGLPSLDFSNEQMTVYVNNAVENLQSMWLVGFVEQYAGLMEVLQLTLDPSNRYTALWEESLSRKENSSPVSSRAVLAALDPDLISAFNSTVLTLQWQVYEVALQLWDTRCREVVLPENQARFCDVPIAPSSYQL